MAVTALAPAHQSGIAVPVVEEEQDDETDADPYIF